MATTKRKPFNSKNDTESSDWEDTSAPKRSKVVHDTALGAPQHDTLDYGTAASQRPQRSRKPPTKFVGAGSVAASRKKKAARPKLATNRKTAGSVSTSKAKSRSIGKIAVRDRQNLEKEEARTKKARFEATSERSLIIRLKISSHLLLRAKPGQSYTSDEEPKARNGFLIVDGDSPIASQREAIPQSYQETEVEPPRTPKKAIGSPATEQDLLTPLPTTSVPVLPPTPESLPRRKGSTPPPRMAISEASETIVNPAYTVGGLTCDVNSESIEAKLRAISDRFHHRGLEKVAPTGVPEVWADGRQELCETLHYYRAYQSACYSTGGFVRGFMFDKVAHVRDYTDSNVIISRAGGGLTKEKDSGEMKSSRDQAEDSIAQGLRNCMTYYNPVVIITGVDNPTVAVKPPYQYCVLGYFKPTHIWIEKSGKSKIVRYRFEKLNTSKISWWRPRDEPDTVELGSLPAPHQRTCQTCGETSLQIYLNGWMCLQASCTAFWKMSSNEVPFNTSEWMEPEESALVYDPRFLKQKTPWPNDDHEYPLISNAAELSGYSIPGEDTSQAFWLGIVCPQCGRCNSRLDWIGWKCCNPKCNFTREPPHTLIPAVSLREPLWPLTRSYTLSRDTHSPIIDVKVSFAHGYRINRYGIPGIDGFITHMIANKTIVEEPGGPDTMFEELQQTDIGLKRRPMPNGQLKGPNHCRHFTVNYGMPYKFIAATASHPFTNAARPIAATRSRLNWAARLLLAQETGKPLAEVSSCWKKQEFNEVLALGYFEAQKINYHDDGEFGLGPTIATLSLGAPGTMRIRMKGRHYHGVSSAGVYDDAAPIPGCQQYDARLALQADLIALKAADSKAYTARRKQIPKELKLRCAGNAKDVLNMALGHGDIVVMHGAEVQKYYEHAVEHAGKLRFALTCRYIDPKSLKQADKPEYVVEPNEGGYDGGALV